MSVYIKKRDMIKALALLGINLILLIFALFWELPDTGYGRKAKAAAIIAGDNPYCIAGKTSSHPLQMLQYNIQGTLLYDWQPQSKEFVLQKTLPHLYLPLRCLPTPQNSIAKKEIPPSMRMSIHDEYYYIYADDQTDFKINDATGYVSLLLKNPKEIPLPSGRVTMLINQRRILPDDDPVLRHYWLNTRWPNQNADKAFREQPYCFMESEQPICLWGEFPAKKKERRKITLPQGKIIHIFLNGNNLIKAVAYSKRLYYYVEDNFAVVADYGELRASIAYRRMQQWIRKRHDENLSGMTEENDIINLLLLYGNSRSGGYNSTEAMIEYADTGKLDARADYVLSEEDKQSLQATSGIRYEDIPTAKKTFRKSAYIACGVTPELFTGNDVYVIKLDRSWRIDKAPRIGLRKVPLRKLDISKVIKRKEIYHPITLILHADYSMHWHLKKGKEDKFVPIANVVLTASSDQSLSSEFERKTSLIKLADLPCPEKNLGLSKKEDFDQFIKWIIGNAADVSYSYTSF